MNREQNIRDRLRQKVNKRNDLEEEFKEMGERVRAKSEGNRTLKEDLLIAYEHVIIPHFGRNNLPLGTPEDVQNSYETLVDELFAEHLELEEAEDLLISLEHAKANLEKSEKSQKLRANAKFKDAELKYKIGQLKLEMRKEDICAEFLEEQRTRMKKMILETKKPIGKDYVDSVDRLLR